MADRAQIPDRARIRTLVEDGWRAAFSRAVADENDPDSMAPVRQVLDDFEATANRMPVEEGDAYMKVALEEINLAMAEFQRDGVEFARRLGISAQAKPLLDVQPVIPAEQIAAMVDDRWRAVFALLASGDPDPLAPVERFFAEIAAETQKEHPTDADVAHVGAMLSQITKTQEEFRRNPIAMRQRLGVAPLPQPRRTTSRQSIGEMAVRTAVRASIWEIVRGIFR